MDMDVTSMSAPKLNIETTRGQIHMESRRAQLQVMQSKQMRLNMRQNAARLNIQTTPGRLQIDQTAAFASSGLKTPLAMAHAFYQNSVSLGVSAISSIVQEGLQFLRIENGGNPVRTIAQGRGVYPKQINVQSMPDVGPSINYTPAQLNIDWTPYSVEADWEVIEAQIDFTPHSIDVWMDPYPSITITVEPGLELDFPTPSGQNVDERT